MHHHGKDLIVRLNAVASLDGFFNWVQVIKDDCTGGCIKLTEVSLIFQTVDSNYYPAYMRRGKIISLSVCLLSPPKLLDLNI